MILNTGLLMLAGIHERSMGQGAIIEDFSDGNLTNNPTWTILAGGGGYGIQNGALVFCGSQGAWFEMRLPWASAVGTWSFRTQATGNGNYAARSIRFCEVDSFNYLELYVGPPCSTCPSSYRYWHLYRVVGGVSTTLATWAPPPQYDLGVWRSVKIEREASGMTRVFVEGNLVMGTAMDLVGPPQYFHVHMQDQLGDGHCKWIDDIVLATCGPTLVQSAELIRTGSPPNPVSLLPGQSARPMVGEVWDPVVDHSTFMPNAAVDFLFVGGLPANISTPFGTALCDPLTVTPVLYAAIAGNPYALYIPPQCGLLGLSLCVQAISANFVTFAYTNALDITIGNQ